MTLDVDVVLLASLTPLLVDSVVAPSPALTSDPFNPPDNSTGPTANFALNTTATATIANAANISIPTTTLFTLREMRTSARHSPARNPSTDATHCSVYCGSWLVFSSADASTSVAALWFVDRACPGRTESLVALEPNADAELARNSASKFEKMCKTSATKCTIATQLSVTPIQSGSV